MSLVSEFGMNPRQTVSVILLGIGLLAVVLHFVRARKLRERYCMLYVFIALIVTIVPVLHHPLRHVATFMGIVDMNSFFFLLAILGLCLICLQLSLALTSAYNQRKALAQQVALLEARVRKLEGAANVISEPKVTQPVRNFMQTASGQAESSVYTLRYGDHGQ